MHVLGARQRDFCIPEGTLTAFTHMCEISNWNYLPDKGHLPCFSTALLQFVVKVQLYVWICLGLCGSEMLQKELTYHKYRHDINTSSRQYLVKIHKKPS